MIYYVKTSVENQVRYLMRNYDFIGRIPDLETSSKWAFP